MIRLAKLSEMNTIAKMLARCGKHLREQGIDQWDENYPNLSQIEIDIKTETCFICVENETILGCVVLNEIQDEEYFQLNWLTKNDARHLMVHRLGVDPKSQGKGIARALMDFSESYAKTSNYHSIRLDTFSQNQRNQRFYLNRNYIEIGKIFLPYKKDHPYHCYEMIL